MKLKELLPFLKIGSLTICLFKADICVFSGSVNSLKRYISCNLRFSNGSIYSINVYRGSLMVYLSS